MCFFISKSNVFIYFLQSRVASSMGRYHTVEQLQLDTWSMATTSPWLVIKDTNWTGQINYCAGNSGWNRFCPDANVSFNSEVYDEWVAYLFSSNQIAIVFENLNFYFIKTAKIPVYGNKAMCVNIARSVYKKDYTLRCLEYICSVSSPVDACQSWVRVPSKALVVPWARNFVLID